MFLKNHVWHLSDIILVSVLWLIDERCILHIERHQILVISQKRSEFRCIEFFVHTEKTSGPLQSFSVLAHTWDWRSCLLYWVGFSKLYTLSRWFKSQSQSLKALTLTRLCYVLCFIKDSCFVYLHFVFI